MSETNQLSNNSLPHISKKQRWSQKRQNFKLLNKDLYNKDMRDSTESYIINLRPQTSEMKMEQFFSRMKEMSELPNKYATLNRREMSKNILANQNIKSHVKFSKNPMSRINLLNVTSIHSNHNKLLKYTMDEYMNDKQKFKSIEQFATLKLNEMSIISTSIQIPNRVRTAICCDLFESIINSNSNYQTPLIKKLKTELFRSIYGENKHFEQPQVIQSTSNILKPNRSVPTSAFFKTMPYFQRCSQLNKKFISDKKRIQKLQSKITQFNESHGYPQILEAHFQAWKTSIIHKQRQKLNIATTMSLQRNILELKFKRSFFSDWKTRVVKKKMLELTYNASHASQKLQDTMKSASALLKQNKIQENELFQLKQIFQNREYTQLKQAIPKMIIAKLDSTKANLMKLYSQIICLNQSEDMVFSNRLLTDTEIDQKKWLSKLSEEQIVLRWVNYQLKQTDLSKKNITNFTSDFRNGYSLFVLLFHLRNDKSMDFTKIKKCFDPSKRNEVCQTMLQELTPYIGSNFVTLRDLINGRADIIFAILAHLMQLHPLLPLIKEHSDVMLNEIKTFLKKLEASTISTPIDNLRQLIMSSESLVEKTENFIHGLKTANIEWLKSVNKVQRKTTNCLATRRKGRSMIISTSLTTNNTWLSFQKLGFLLLSHSEILKIELNEFQVNDNILEELKQCNEIIEKYRDNILEIFEFYGSKEVVTFPEIRRFTKEFQIQNKIINSVFLSQSITYCQLSAKEYLNSLKESIDENQSNRIKVLSFQQFIELLLRISWRKYKDANKLTLSQKLLKLLKVHVIRHNRCGNSFQDTMFSDSMRNLFNRLEQPLFEVFSYFAESKKKDSFLSFAEALTMMQNLKLISNEFNANKLKQIFNQVMEQEQQRAKIIQKTAKNGKLTYVGYLELLTVIAMYKKPDPYISLETKVEEFLLHSIINPLYNQQIINHNVGYI